MTLLARTTTTRMRLARINQHRAERRLDEIVKVAGIADDYGRVDRAGDIQVEVAFARCYQLVDTDEERAAIADAFAVWQRTEKAEDLAVTGSVDEAVDLLKTNNPIWLNGAAVPGDSDGAA